MKDNINVPIPREENLDALRKRRENYAIARDLQASEFNEAIAKRFQSEDRNQIKCNVCGKEFESLKREDTPQTCPECISKPEKSQDSKVQDIK